VHLLAIGVFLQTDASGRETETAARWPRLPTPRPASGSTAVFDTDTASWADMAQVLRYTLAVPAACRAHASNKCYRSQEATPPARILASSLVRAAEELEPYTRAALEAENAQLRARLAAQEAQPEARANPVDQRQLGIEFLNRNKWWLGGRRGWDRSG
jgi:hypothetical protein